MFTRIAQQTKTPDQEDMDLGAALCPPHEFDAGWASPQAPKDNDDTIPALWCKACGEIRAFRIPSDAS